jgi:spore germination protein GerM
MTADTNSSTPRPARKPSSSSLRWLWIAAIGAVMFIVSFVGMTLYRGSSSETPAATPRSPSPSAPGQARKIHVQLFYVSDDGIELVSVSREVAYGATAADQARQIIERQLEAAPAGAHSAIPAGTTLRALYVTARGEAYVDLSAEVATAHPGGSLSESLTVFAIVNALTVNLPTITAVQILVDGKAVDTLAGHVDLRHPLERSLKWVRKGQ